ncbi:MAG: magnesium transporter [Gemmatimonadales bacterium]
MKPALHDQTTELVALAREGRVAAFIDRARHLAPVDLADVLVELPAADRRKLAVQLPARLAAVVLAAMPPDAHSEATLNAVGPERAAQLIAELDEVDAAHLLGRLPAADRHPILAALADRSSLDQLLSHGSGTAGALMASRMVVVGELDPIALAAESVRRQASAIGDLTEILVVDTARRLCGVLSVKQLLLAPGPTLVRDVMLPNVVHVDPAEDAEVVARVIARYNLASVPVVDRAGHLLGRVTADDVRDVTVHEVTADLLRFGGVSASEVLDARWSQAVRSRLPWLYANLLPAFGAAAVVFFFKGSVVRIVTLAVWMPVVAGVGGNAGTQALATAVRRLLVHPARPPGLRQLVAREAAIGALNGIAMGAVVAFVAVLLGESWKLGVVVLLAMTLNLVLAGIAGATIPMVLKRLGRDPALASPVLVTALTDACGFALLLGLATAMLL